MSIVRRQLILTDTLQPETDNELGSTVFRRRSTPRWVVMLCCSWLLVASAPAWAADPAPVNEEALLTTIREYADAVGNGDRVATGQRDFVCLHQMAQQQLFSNGNFPDPSHPI